MLLESNVEISVEISPMISRQRAMNYCSFRKCFLLWLLLSFLLLLHGNHSLLLVKYTYTDLDESPVGSNNIFHKSWPLRNDSSRWCYSPYSRRQDRPGLLFVKLPKAASSTLAGINIRIARQVGSRTPLKKPFLNKQQSNICSHSFKHGRDLLLQRSKRSKQSKQLLWSFVREPSDRAISAFYHFQASRKQAWPTMGHMITYLQTKEASNFQFKYLATHPDPEQLLDNAPSSQERDSIIQRVILQEYAFLGIVERWTESLAVLVILWGLNVDDVIVLSSKLAGGYDDGRYQTAGNCVKIQKADIQAFPQQDRDYLRNFLNTTFLQNNRFDFKLYRMANQRLTDTINTLGKMRVETVQYQIESLQTLIQSKCFASAVFPCSENGTWQYQASKSDCYWFDSGCGYPCVDKTLLNFHQENRN